MIKSQRFLQLRLHPLLLACGLGLQAAPAIAQYYNPQLPADPFLPAPYTGQPQPQQQPQQQYPQQQYPQQQYPAPAPQHQAPSPYAHITTKITLANGSEPRFLAVSPTLQLPQVVSYSGDVIELQADEVQRFSNGTETRSNMAPSSYVWSSDLSSNDVCDQASQNCVGTNFQVTPSGVNFYVPQYNQQSIPQDFRIFVQNRYTGQVDQIAVHTQYVQQPQNGNVYTDPSYYPESQQFDFNTALNGLGQWTVIGGSRVFVPVFHVQDWQPYQHGHWYWTQYGWTWMSYDPWGWVTDHYGYWRHHNSHGWVWAPFAAVDNRHHWRPAVVTFYNTNDYIGWSPYWDGWAGGQNGYVQGYAHGYNDGFWDGFNAANQGQYQFGYTCVPTRSFVSQNIYRVRVTREVAIVQYRSAYSTRQYGRYAVVNGRQDNARVFVETRAGRSVQRIDVDTRTRVSTGGGSVVVVQPRSRAYAVPQEYERLGPDIAGRLRDPSRRVPVGSGIDRGGRAIQQPTRGPTVVQPQQPVVREPQYQQPQQPTRGGPTVQPGGGSRGGSGGSVRQPDPVQRQPEPRYQQPQQPVQQQPQYPQRGGGRQVVTPGVDGRRQQQPQQPVQRQPQYQQPQQPQPRQRQPEPRYQQPQQPTRGPTAQPGGGSRGGGQRQVVTPGVGRGRGRP